MQFLHVEELSDVMYQYMPANSTLFEAGTYTGKTLNNIINLAAKVDKPFSKVYTADAFQGLPAEASYVPNNNDEWPPGVFSLMTDQNLNTVDECVDFVRGRVDRKDINIITGWFEETFTDKLAEEVGPTIGYLHVDCDLFSSSHTVLQWIFKHKLLLPQCVCRFDDWHQRFEYFMGQPLAWKLATQKYNITWQQVGMNVFLFVK